jgi:signal transduction histidine kinase
MAVILRDVTEARHHAATTIESEKLSALTLLAAGVAHELGNPLNSLNIHLQLMERELKGLPPDKAQRLQEDLQVARDEINRLDNIIHQFLRAIRPTRPDLRRAQVNRVVEESLALLDREIADRDILLETEWAPDPPDLLVDRGQLKQAFYNVVKNALQAMRPGGILRVATENAGEWVTVSFSDNGQGISAEQIGRIFEPYYTSKKGGSGLGLMIVQRIVREHGGTIEIESNAGRGTTVRIKLPVRERRTRLLEAGKQ